MVKQILTRGHNELFRRSPDEAFASLDELWQHCQRQRTESQDVWERPESLLPVVNGNRLELGVRGEAADLSPSTRSTPCDSLG